LPERLELKPSGKRGADERVGVLRGFGGNLARLARGFGQQLRLAGAIHGDEPPGGFVNGAPNGEQPVVEKDSRFFRSEDVSNAVAFGSFFDDAAIIIENDAARLTSAWPSTTLPE